MKTDKELLLEIIDDNRKDLLKSKVNQRYFEMESADPKKMGKQDALEHLAVWTKHINTIEIQIKTFELYIEEVYGK